MQDRQTGGQIERLRNTKINQEMNRMVSRQTNTEQQTVVSIGINQINDISCHTDVCMLRTKLSIKSKNKNKIFFKIKKIKNKKIYKR